MRKLFAMSAALLVAGGAFAADPLPTTIAGIRTNVGSRTVAFDDSAPVVDGTVNTGEYTYSSGLIVSNGVTTTSDGSDGYGDITSTIPPTDAADLSFTVHMSHDADNLYVAVEVTDDLLVNDRTTPQNFWEDDTIELYIDADNTANGRFNAAVGVDRPGTAGGRVNFASSTEGDETAADIVLNGGNSGTAYGPSFTIPSSTWGRSNGTDLAASAVDSTPGAANPLTDIEFFMHRLDPANNGNRVLEVRIPKTGLSYNRTTSPAAGAPVNCGVFTNDIIGFRVAVTDDDDGTASDHGLTDENAAENLDGAEIVKNALDAELGPFSTLIVAAYDAVEIGIKDGQAWNYEAACPRYQLVPGATPTAVKAWDYR